MAQYMLLLCAPEANESEMAARWAELPEWLAVTEQFRREGVWVANGPLDQVETATTVRVRNGDMELAEGRLL